MGAERLSGPPQLSIEASKQLEGQNLVWEALARIPPKEWERFWESKIAAGLTRPWKGVSSQDVQQPYQEIIQLTKAGEVVIPTYTMVFSEDEWRKVVGLVRAHISALRKFGSAVLKTEREGRRVSGLPSLAELGFSEQERKVLLARPEITECVLTRTDLSGNGRETWRYETNTSQPGGAEVVDYYAIPDAIRGSLPVVGEVLAEIGVNNHRVLPSYIEACRKFWEEYHGNKPIEGILVLSGGYGFGTKLLMRELKENFSSVPVMVDRTEAPRPAEETREAIWQAAINYASTVASRFRYQDKKLKYYDGQALCPVSLILHEPRIDIEHFAALWEGDLMRAWKDGVVEIINPPQARVCGSKLTECYLSNPETWQAMAQVGYGLTEEEKQAERLLTIPTMKLSPEALEELKNKKGEKWWQKLVIKPANAGSGRGVILGRRFNKEDDFKKLMEQIFGCGEDYIAMDEKPPAERGIILHRPGAPRIKTLVGFAPYGVVFPGGIEIPGCVSRAFLPLTPEEEQLAQEQGVKLNVLGRDNYFVLPDGTRRQYMVAIGQVVIV